MNVNQVGPQPGASQLVGGSTLPASPLPRDIFSKISGGSEGVYVCLSSGTWTLLDASGAGDVQGPASATDNAIARFDSTTGKLIQNSVVIVADTTGNISGAQKVTVGVAASATGSLEFVGTTSGIVTVKSADVAGTWTMTLPANDGDSGQYLQTDGAGITSWQTVAAGPTINATDGVIPYRSSSAAFTDSPLVREDANTIGQRNGTAGQVFSVYRTYTSGSNYGRLHMGTNLYGAGIVGVVYNETGASAADPVMALGNDSNGSLIFRSAGATQWKMVSADLLANIDNTGDIGASGANRPRNLYLGTGLAVEATITAGGTTGAQTINKTAGTVNMAAGQSTLVVTDSLCTANSLVFAVVRTNDATATIKNVVAGSGSFTITLTAAATAETSLGFFLVQPD